MAKGFREPLPALVECLKIRPAKKDAPQMAVLTISTSQIQAAVELMLGGTVQVERCQLSIEDLMKFPEFQGGGE